MARSVYLLRVKTHSILQECKTNLSSVYRAEAEPSSYNPGKKTNFIVVSPLDFLVFFLPAKFRFNFYRNLISCTVKEIFNMEELLARIDHISNAIHNIFDKLV